MSLLDLPLEIRLQIYLEVFEQGITNIDGGRQDAGPHNSCPSILPQPAEQFHLQPRSAQLLRTCKKILREARPILYNNTVFRSFSNAFAGRMPVKMTNDHPSFQHTRHLEWTLHCDMLKCFDAADVRIEAEDTRKLRTVRLDCQSESWKGSYCGEWKDRQVFVQGRQHVVDFAKILQTRMSTPKSAVALIEDMQYLSRGRVVLKLHRGRFTIGANVSCISIHTPSILTLTQEVVLV